jgi:hypothetical protein
MAGENDAQSIQRTVVSLKILSKQLTRKISTQILHVHISYIHDIILA